MAIPFLGRLPIYEPIRVGGDTGRPIVVTEPQSPVAQAFRAVAEQAAAQISLRVSLYDSTDSGPLTFDCLTRIVYLTGDFWPCDTCHECFWSFSR